MTGLIVPAAASDRLRLRYIPRGLHNVSMTNVLVRDLPDETHEKLVHKAYSSGQSLQQYLTDQLNRLADTPTMSEALERIAANVSGRVGFDQAVEDLAEERDRR